MNSYADIINHPHYRSKTRTPMTMLNRAAQFAPFAALSGYEESVRETERLSRERIEKEEAGYRDPDDLTDNDRPFSGSRP